MISVVILHVNADFLLNVKNNIKKTIGVDYELIVIDNRDGRYDLFSGYNLGVKRSRFPIICFMHEDILLHTNRWGQKVVGYFNNSSLGLLGIVGGTAMPKVPATWWTRHPLNIHYTNLIQHWTRQVPPNGDYRQVIQGTQTTRDYNNPTDQELNSVIAVDGLWFCVRRDLFFQIKFDESTFHGFHFYDIDICFQVLECGYDLMVTSNILIEHFSEGNLTSDWFRSALLFSEKWNRSLPKYINKENVSNEAEIKALLTFLYWMQSADISKALIRLVIWKYIFKIWSFKVSESYLLLFWGFLGYKIARYPYKVIKVLKKIKCL